ncbi:MAG: ImmA/IrrE family metallo-endopeptidase [Burkholderiales bacterium]|nr:ImmA/IrrE family metallo-endopeptidase [Nitrosomonas sp.]MCP5275526.1 ImmA/IrrE family metallo-endopeptidase [Burkholderiales bacterium]
MDCRWAEKVAEKYLEENSLLRLPVDPIAIAEKHGIVVQAKPATDVGVSGMLIKHGDMFGIAYATHVKIEGFQRFSVAHELGHYLLPGHYENILPNDGVHESKAGFFSGNKYEREADHFAAGLLMPRSLFTKEIDKRSSGYEAINKISDICKTSLTATAIRYTQFTSEPIAVILSADQKLDWCFMSDELKEIGRLDWPKKGQIVPKDSVTHVFNKNIEYIKNGQYEAGSSSFIDWFGGNRDFEIEEEVIGLGSYGKTLTILTVQKDLDELEEEDQLEEIWTPRFKR